MPLLLLLAAASMDPVKPSGDVPPAREAAWTACRNEKLTVSVEDEMEGCDALIAADDVDSEIKAVAHANRGMIMAQASFLVTAKDELDEAIALNPKLAPAYYNRALVMELTGDPARAISDYSTAIDINPKMVEAYVNRAIARAKAGLNDQALADFTKVIELEPDNADNYNNRAMLLREMGRTAEADADEAKARELAKK